MPWVPPLQGALGNETNRDFFEDYLDPLPEDTRYWVECCFSARWVEDNSGRRSVSNLELRHPLAGQRRQGEPAEPPLNPSLLLNRLYPHVGFEKRHTEARLLYLQSWCAKASGEPQQITAQVRSRRKKLLDALDGKRPQMTFVATLCADVQDRLLVGLGGPHPRETALTLHPLYGFPYLPGSAIKGVVRHAHLRAVGEQLGVFPLAAPVRRDWKRKTPLQSLEHFLQTRMPSPQEQQARQQYEEAFSFWKKRLRDAMQGGFLPESDAVLLQPHLTAEAFDSNFREPFCRLFGSTDQQGGVTFLDALPETWTFEVDVMTPHFSAWYASGRPPSDSENDPIPLLFLTVGRGSRFRFDLMGSKAEDVNTVHTLLAQTLENVGIGAKTAAGYGYMTPVVESTATYPSGKAHGNREEGSDT